MIRVTIEINDNDPQHFVYNHNIDIGSPFVSLRIPKPLKFEDASIVIRDIWRYLKEHIDD